MKIPTAKINELLSALTHRNETHIVVYGPPRSGKTTLIKHCLSILNLVPIEIDDVAKFDANYISSNEIGYVDSEKNERFSKNTIVETRTFLKGGLHVRTNPIKAVYVPQPTTFHKLGKLFYKSEKIEIEMAKEYIFESYLDFMELNEAFYVIDCMSLNLNDDVLIQTCVQVKKKKPQKFFCFKISQMLLECKK